MKNNTRTNDAVSPVIGVMLMLIVTIIIAAVVSGFVGGIASTSEKTPQIILKGTYSQANGMTLTHASGDTIAIQDYNFMTTPSDAMGTDSGKFAWMIDKTIILDPKNSNKPIYNATTSTFDTRSFSSGDTLVINTSSCTDYSKTGTISSSTPGVNANARVFWEGTNKNKFFGAYSFGNPSNVGKPFYLDLVDKTGKVIARAVVTIKS
jgi:archaeal type IV pilus assembly protein PilA